MKRYAFLTILRILQIYFAGICTIFSASVFADENASSADMKKYLFEKSMTNFSAGEYKRAVESFFSEFEKTNNQKITRGQKGKVGLKVYTNSGAGLSTPIDLVEAVIASLEKRGYARKDICIVDMRRQNLRVSGFLPKLSEVQRGTKDDYMGCPVYDISSEKYYSPDWFYDNSMPAKEFLRKRYTHDESNMETRKSFLPVTLFLTVDFWINLPVITDMSGIGVCASLGNATLWNMSNNERFFKANANAPVTVAEVAAIPELHDSWLFSILSFEYAQIVGGAVYNQAYVASKRMMLCSANPVAIDYIAWQFLNTNRAAFGFEPIAEEPVMFEYCRQMELGEYDFSKIKRVIVQ